MKETTKCGKEAKFWCGYVLRKKKKITAGWCAWCFKDPGFVGHYKGFMKLKDVS